MNVKPDRMFSGFFLHGFLLHFREPLNEVTVGQEVCGFSRVVLELLAQLSNESPQICQRRAPRARMGGQDRRDAGGGDGAARLR